MQDKYNRRLHGYLLSSVFVIVSIGTVVYHFVEHLGWIDSYYFSVVTLATVGFGDIVPHTIFGKIFTTFYIFFGIGIVVSYTRSLVLRRAAKIRKRDKRRK
jgi:voltage-gated potassium channel